MDESRRIAAFIDAWRDERNMSGNAFTQRAGVASNFLTQLRRGADVQLNTLARAAEAMDMTLLELLAAAGVGGSLEPSASDERGSGRPDILALIATDPDLLPEARQHFANQYELLRRLNPANGDAARLKAVAHAPEEPLDADQDEAAYEA